MILSLQVRGFLEVLILMQHKLDNKVYVPEDSGVSSLIVVTPSCSQASILFIIFLRTHKDNRSLNKTIRLFAWTHKATLSLKKKKVSLRFFFRNTFRIWLYSGTQRKRTTRKWSVSWRRCLAGTGRRPSTFEFILWLFTRRLAVTWNLHIETFCSFTRCVAFSRWSKICEGKLEPVYFICLSHL